MTKSTLALTATAILTLLLLIACDKAPGGVIKESKMAHVLADFAKAGVLIEQNPSMFPDDSSKLALKQSILHKYDATLAMYDSSLVWYAHNLKIYSQVHDKAIQILEKEGNINSSSHNRDAWIDGAGNTAPSQGNMQQISGAKRVFPTSGDSANVWNEPQRWILTSTMPKGLITFDYKPDRECRPGDLYALNMKMISNNSVIKLMLAIDYQDGTMIKPEFVGERNDTKQEDAEKSYTFAQIFDNWKAATADKNYNPVTERGYLRYLTYLNDYCTERGIDKVSKYTINTDMARDFENAMSKRLTIPSNATRVMCRIWPYTFGMYNPWRAILTDFREPMEERPRKHQTGFWAWLRRLFRR